MRNKVDCVILKGYSSSHDRVALDISASMLTEGAQG